MFLLAISTGIYSYLIFFLGIFGLLYKEYILITTAIYVIVVLILNFHFSIFNKVKNFNFKIYILKIHYKFQISNLKLLFLFVLVSQMLVNLVGALGPELAFDALWYHLTLPKVFLLYHRVFFIPGLLQYSVMPKLTEMIYIGALTVGNEVTVKLLQYVFGFFVCIALYRLSRKFFTPVVSLIAVVIFYSNLVVAWESTTAYIDLARAFFEILSISAFINWIDTKKWMWFVTAAVLVGFSIATKVLALGSLGIFVVLIVYDAFTKRFGQDYPTLLKLRWASKSRPAQALFRVVTFSCVALLVPLPWFIFSFISTGNPVYPFFTKTYAVSVHESLLNPIHFLQSFWNLFTHAADPLSPVYIMFLPLVIFTLQRSWKTYNNSKKILIFYAILALLIWYVTPDTGGGRFIVPYLPVFSLITASVFAYPFPKWFTRVLLGIVLCIAILSVGYRGLANKRYVPVILGRETKSAFLTNNLNFSFGDFYDTDNYFATHIKSSDRVLLYGFHNLYYVNFPFVESSYIAKGERFNYIAIQHGTIPERFNDWRLRYENPKTFVKLYSLQPNRWISY